MQCQGDSDQMRFRVFAFSMANAQKPHDLLAQNPSTQAPISKSIIVSLAIVMLVFIRIAAGGSACGCWSCAKQCARVSEFWRVLLRDLLVATITCFTIRNLTLNPKP